jgi:DNA-binding IclR family transcriptional regulator
MEEAARSSEGVSLADLAHRLEAPKSSIQELTNGLLAAGYLIENSGRFVLGPGAFILSLQTAGLPLRRVLHEELERAQEHVGLALFVGARVGDDQVFIDQAGEDVLLDFVSAQHPRRPLLITATGKILLAWMSSVERNAFLRRKQREEPERVAQFLEELSEIRETRLAYNRGVTVPGRFTVAAPLVEPDGTFLAAICAVGGPEIEDRLPEVGATLLEAVDAWRFPRRRRRS